MNRAEEEGMRQLRDLLPDDYVVIGNFEMQLPRRRNSMEFDAVVIGPYGVWAVEIKGWSGEVRGDMSRWQLEWGRVECPFVRTEPKAKALRDLLARRAASWPAALYCEAVVLLVGRKLDVQVHPAHQARVLTSAPELVAFFVSQAQAQHERGEQPLVDEALREEILSELVPNARSRQVPRVLSDYEILAELDRPQSAYREFVGRHLLLRTRSRVRIKSYALDALATSREREVAYRRALRDMEALSALEDNPYVARAYEMFRDMEDEQIFYVVSEWVGPQTLREAMDLQRVGGGRGPWMPWSLGHHLLQAVSFMHEREIVHRDLHPGAIYVTSPSSAVPLKVADFDFARVAQLESIAEGITDIGTEGYVAPELWREPSEGTTHDQRVDIFSVGVILYELLTGRRLYESALAILRHEQVWQRQRAWLPCDASRAVFDRLLAYEASARATTLDEALRFFEGRLSEACG